MNRVDRGQHAVGQLDPKLPIRLVQGVEFEVQGLGFGVWGLEFRV